MQEAGLEVLTAKQIKPWWRSYHRKNQSTALSSAAPAPTPASMPHASTLSSVPAAPTQASVHFPEEFSQSTIGGRSGNNACAFICFYFGQEAP